MPKPYCKEENYHLVKHHTGGLVDRAYPVCCPKEATYSKHHVCIQESGGLFGVIGKHHVAHGRAHPVQMAYSSEDKLKCLDPSYRLVSHHKAGDNTFFNQMKEKFTHLFGHGMSGSEKVCCPSLAPYAYDGKCFAEKTGLFVKDYARPWVDVHGRPLAPVMPVPNSPDELKKFGIGVKKAAHKPAAHAPRPGSPTQEKAAAPAAKPAAAPADKAAAPVAKPAAASAQPEKAAAAASAPAISTAVVPPAASSSSSSTSAAAAAAPAPPSASSASPAAPAASAPAPAPAPAAGSGGAPSKAPAKLVDEGESGEPLRSAYRFDEPHALEDDEEVAAGGWDAAGPSGEANAAEYESEGAPQWSMACEAGSWEQASVDI
eukprot:tig00000741_g3836.t1